MSGRVIGSLILLAVAGLVVFRAASRPRTAATARVAPRPATGPAGGSEADRHATAEARRFQAFQLLLEAREAERGWQLVEAWNLYTRALDLDPHNAAATDGRDRMKNHLDEEKQPRQPQAGAARRILAGPPDTTIRFDDAYAQWRAARAAADRNPRILPPSQIKAFQQGLGALDQRISEAAAEAAAASPSTRPASHSR